MIETRRVHPHRSAGFSLLEVLVALAIMALSLGVLYQSMGSATRGAQVADRTERASLWATSLLARWPERGRGGWQDSGTTPDGYAWQVTSAPSGDRIEGYPSLDFYEVEVVVSWGDGQRARSVRLHTIRPQVRTALRDS
ncbi:MAG: prepilin-type N-terminal cleavage/methylation domain-containing protein [Rhodocyclaceae bacterium]|nr:prepilin-type N-terminal cleavage/methylation domain-containing protein [Rhodocyclaceae bacterium]